MQPTENSKNEAMVEICEGLVEVCNLMAKRPFEKKKPKRERCRCCKRLTGKIAYPETKKEHIKTHKELMKRSEKFKGLAELFRKEW